MQIKMKQYIKYIVILFLSPVPYGCNQADKNVNEKAAIIADIDKEDKVSVFDLFEKVEIVPLETTDSSLIRSILKLICHNNMFYILDYNSVILAFDATGKFKFKIDNRGQGPNQYTHISDFDIDRERAVISFIAPVVAELHEYDLNGQFLHKYRLPQITAGYNSLKHLSKNVIAFWTFDYDNRLKFYSKEENRIFSECFPEEDNFFDQIHIQTFTHDHYILRSLDNNVYEMSHDGTVSVAYTWDFGKLNIDYNKLDAPPVVSLRSMADKERISNYMKQISSSEIVNYIFHVSGGNAEYAYSQIMRKDRYINIMYHKTRKRTLLFEKTTENAGFYPLYWTDDFVTGCIPENFLPENLDAVIPDAILDAENIERKNQYSEFDNPLLIKYCFKK
jgi:hypothetical protein